MDLSPLFEPLRDYDSSKLSAFAVIMVESCRRDYARLKELEKNYGPTFEDPAKDEAALRMLRVIWKDIEDWTRAAERVLACVKDCRSAGSDISGAADLADDYGFARARLTVDPQDIIEGIKEARPGEGVSSEVLRDELRRRRSA